MTSGTRLPTWKERENNKRRERRRRAIAAKIFAGLRMYGNYKLPKHCDNNEVLKALCAEAGWTVEEDGTTYRKGCKPMDRMDVVGGSAPVSPCSSYHPSPAASYNPSPASSSFQSPASSSYVDGNSLIPWLKNLSSTSSSHKLPNLYINTGSISAPVTPPLSSPTSCGPRVKTDWESGNHDPATSNASGAPWPHHHYAFLPNSTPPSPGHQDSYQNGFKFNKSDWLAGFRLPSCGGPTSPTFSLVTPASNPFGSKDEYGSSPMWTPGQSGTCSPSGKEVVPDPGDIRMMDASEEFAFGNTTVVKAWEGERIHEECGPDELELTLGSSRTRSAES
ncbi:BES1/BZR1 homolog protein 4 [Nymphaea colorata]|nr:BES1/BZR1 homolog protein 4 [Nymphaea colorata]XP_031504621.1 BES1/BZR1 homolog protein 4 [Nymphaea colorata]